MVYIPPMKDTKYDQYAEREVKRSGNPFRLSQSSRINPIKHPKQFSVATQVMTRKETIKMDKTSVSKIKKKVSNRKLISEITGKGRNFDERV